MSNASLAVKAPMSSVEYAIVGREPSLAAEETERADLEVTEVAVRWGRTTLGITHVADASSLSVGEADGSSIMIPEERLGVRSFRLVERGVLRVPAGATGTIEEGGVERALEGASVELKKGMRVRLALPGDLVVAVSRVAAGRPTPRRRSLKRGIFAIAACSLFVHAAATVAMAAAPGASLDDESAPLDHDTAARMIAMNESAAAHEQPKPETDNAGPSGGGQEGGAHKGPSGLAGKPTAQNVDAAYALQGVSKEQHLGAIRNQIESGRYGAIGALATVFGNSTIVDPTSAFAESVGDHEVGYVGHITGKDYGDSFGYNGLGMHSYGPGGDGFSDGLGLGMGPWFGHGPGNGGPNSGVCAGGADCTGSGLSGKKRPKTGGTIIETTSDVTGGLPKEVVRRIVRANFPYFRQCYETGLKKDPELRGVVTTRFIIDTTGAVESASLSSSTLSDGAVSACVVGVFRNMSFPAPENGKAMVTYPLDLQKD